jgi:hypothetical protein
MGTTCAVVYVNIHMILIEWTVVYNYKQCLILYNPFFYDGICFWIGSDAEFRAFSDHELGEVDPSIGLIWSKLSLQAVYVDLSIQIADTICYETYSKPGNAFAFLPLGSFHVRKTFPELNKTAGILYSALSHLSDYSRWAQKCQL